MFRKCCTLLALLFTGLVMSGFSSRASAAEEGGNPWWIWIVIFFALVAFVVFVIWWWMRGFKEEEEELSPPERYAPAAPASEVQEEAPQPDDLKRIEGIGPKIASVLQAAGITTFAQLAATDVERLQEILREADPNLIRLADPGTWPDQAGLAAEGRWAELEKLQNELKGGRRA
jgi:predicted flap endonuclease-1-like 5' DNA nuclease